MKSSLFKLVSQRLWLIPVLAVLLVGCGQNQQEQPSSPQTPTTPDQTETSTTPERTEAPTTPDQTETPSETSTTPDQTETAETREQTDRTSVTSRVDSVSRSRRSAVKLETVYFPFDSYRLTDTAKKQLRRVAQSMKNNPRLRIQIEGHTDERGSEEYNLELGQKRAEAVKEFLIAQGVDPEMLSTLSLGTERPALSGSTPKAWARNRRVEFIVLK